jgi:DNA topoisomerase III
LNPDQAKVFELVARRFVAAFYPDYKYKTTRVITGVGEHRFLSQGKMVIDTGWREVWGSVEKDTEIPALAAKDPVKVEKVETEAKKTLPPPRYTDATILAAMANAARFVTDGELKKILKETAGLGTPATRAAIIQTLISRRYVDRSKKLLMPTEKGIHLIGSLKGEKIIDPAYTAVWEQTLDDIAGGKRGGMKTFQSAIASDLRAFVTKARTLKSNGSHAGQANGGGSGSKASAGQKVVGRCPVCGSPVIEMEKGYACSAGREKCGFIFWKDSLKRFGGKKLTAKQATVLLERKDIVLKGLKSKSTGNKYDAAGYLAEYIQNGSGKPAWGVSLKFDNARAAGGAV